MLEALLERNPEISSIIPGDIRRVRKARGAVKIRITTPTHTGWKAIALASGARQELFLTTKMSRGDLDIALQRAPGGSVAAGSRPPPTLDKRECFSYR